MYSFEVTPVIGLPQFDGWSQVVASPDNSFACLLFVSSSHASNVGRDLVDFINSQIPPNSALMYSLAKKILYEAEKKDAEVGFVMLLINHDKVAMLAHKGQVYLRRKEKLGQVLSSLDDIQMVEGPLQEADHLIMTSERSREFISEIKIKISQGYDMDTIVTSLIPSVHSLDNSSLSALIFLKVVSKVALHQDPPSQDQNFPVQINLSEDLTNESPSDQQTVQSPSIVTYPPELIIDKPDNQAKTKKIMQQLLQVGQSGLVSVIKVTKSLFSQIIKSTRSNIQGEVYVGGYNKRRVAKILLPALLVIILVVGAGYYFYSSRQGKIDELNNVLTPVVTNIETGKNLSENDPIRAREILSAGLSELETIKSQQSENYLVKIVDEKISDTTQFLSSISGKEELQELPVFFDLSLIESDFIASKMVVVGSKAVILDTGKKEIIILDVESKQFDKVDLSDKSAVKDVTIEDGVNNTALLLTSGIDSLVLNNQRVENEIAENDTTQNATMIGGFNNSVYLLDQSSSDIIRFASSDEGYEAGKKWFRTTPNLDFKTITSMTIDGDIWLGTSLGEILKNSSGQKSDFAPIGVSPEFSSALIIHTRKDAANLFVLEPEKNRLVIINKNGEFLQEVISPSLALANSLSVSEDFKTVYLTAGSVLYKLTIEN